MAAHCRELEGNSQCDCRTYPFLLDGVRSHSMSIVSINVDSAAELWLRLFYAKPRLTLTITLLAIAALGLIIYSAVQQDQKKQEVLRQRTLDYQTQLTELSRTEDSLRNLTTFVQSQKTKLKESEDLIADLKAEHERLKPFVEGDRKVVQAVFDLQEERKSHIAKRERWIGFGLGVISSIVASFVYAVISLMWRRYSAQHPR